MVGIVHKIYIAADKRDVVVGIEEAILEKDKGIVGDRYHALAEIAAADGKAAPENQVTLVDKDELDAFLAKHNADLDYGDFRRSIVTSGIDLNALVGKEFVLGEARCLGVELCEPCAYLAASVHKAVLPDLVHRGGLRAVVVESGKVRPGTIIKSA